MNTLVVPALDLAPPLVQRWRSLHDSIAGLSSPFLHPAFTRAVAEVRDDVFVCVLSDGDQAEGFFAFERCSEAKGQPVGQGVSDLQAVVCRPSSSWDPVTLIRACGLRSWSFDHALASQAPLAPFHEEIRPSPYIDLSRGFDDWVAGKKREGSQLVKSTRRRLRNLERDFGPVRFRADNPDPEALARLMALKSVQYLRRNTYDRFAIPWIVRLLERLLETRSPDFGGILSTLHAGDRLAAAHMGLRSRHLWHWWFTVYDPAFSKYSAGTILDLLMTEAAGRLGIRRIDLGKKGDKDYFAKARLMNGAYDVAAGTVSSRPFKIKANE